jgi:hypothetical protein
MAAVFSMHHLERSARIPELVWHQYFVSLSKFGVQQAIKLIFQLKRARPPGWPLLSHASFLDPASRLLRD